MATLYEVLSAHCGLNDRFHTPSHNGVDIDGKLYASAPFDITELPFSDNLLSADGCIAETERELAKAYGAEYAMMFTNGATGGIYAALAAAADISGLPIAVVDGAHKSCYAALDMLKIGRIDAADTSAAAEYAKKGHPVFVTSPDYYGRVADLSPLKEVKRSRAFILITDEAHGAHFAFSSLLPESAAALSDICVESMHKTLPVFTGGAAVTANGEETYRKLLFYRAKLHSTSPNYMIMASMDYAREYMAQNGERLYAELKRDLDADLRRLDCRYSVVGNDDFTRLVVECADADAVYERLCAKGIYAEMCDGDRIVFILTPFNMGRIARLIDALNGIDGVQGAESENMCRQLCRNAPYGYRNIDEAEGCVSAAEVGIYPPGTPFLKCGDVITRSHIELMKKNEGRLFGPVDGMLAVKERS